MRRLTPSIGPLLSAAAALLVVAVAESWAQSADAAETTPVARLTNPSGGAVSPACALPPFDAPRDLVVFAVGGYEGRDLGFQIDDSGHEATAVDLVINAPGRAVALMLSAYEPTVWSLRWTEGTEISAVFASGYHRQAVLGAPKSTPVLTSAVRLDDLCGYWPIRPDRLVDLDPLAKRLFGRSVKSVSHFGPDGAARVGPPPAEAARLIFEGAIEPETLIDPNAPLAGRAGLRAAVAAGVLRPASGADIDAWAAAAGVAFGPDQREAAFWRGEVFLVVAPFRYPAGLFGAHAATFFIAAGAPAPEGNPGHSSVFDIGSGTCVGPGCPRL